MIISLKCFRNENLFLGMVVAAIIPHKITNQSYRQITIKLIFSVPLLERGERRLIMENKILKKFEATDVIIEVIDGIPMFELYSTGMALGYSRKNGVGKSYPRNSRIDTTCKNAGIKPCVHDGHSFLNENQLYDFMFEAHTDKCKPFRKWVVEEVLPMINKTGGYVESDMEEEFVNNYLPDLSEEVKVLVIKDLRENNKRLKEENSELKEFYDKLQQLINNISNI